jgi:hypothetical protein
VEVYTTGTPYRTFRVEKDGYAPYTGSVPRMPMKAENIDLYATLNPVTAPVVVTPQGVGGDKGWFAVHSNVDGATVLFDGIEKGKIVQGVLSVQVYVTGTPYRSFTVEKEGYIPYTGSITTTPVKGQTIDLYATLNPRTWAPGITAPTEKAPLLPAFTLVATAIAGFCAAALRRKSH